MLDVMAVRDVVAGQGLSLGDCADIVAVRVVGVLLLAPAVLGFVALVGFEVRRWWRFRQGRPVALQGVVRGKGAGFHSAPMPGRLHLTPGGVWWVAEGTDGPVPVRGLPVSVASQNLGRGVSLMGQLLEQDDVAAGVPAMPQPLPKPLWQGAIDNPSTVVVQLDAGGYVEVSVRGESMGKVLEVLSEPHGRSAGDAPPIGDREPLLRFTPVIVGATVVLAGLGVAMLLEAGSCPDSVDGLWVFAGPGLMLMVWGLSILPKRGALVRANRQTLIDGVRPVPALAVATAGRTAAGDQPTAVGPDPGEQVQPSLDEPSLTYRAIRDALARWSAAEGWADVKPIDPRDERRARRAVGSRSVSHARAAVAAPTRTRGRYLLARDAAGDDQLILFPPYGDVAPIGIIDMMRPCLGAIPLEAAVDLAGPVDPVTRQPMAGEWVVPVFDSAPLWPGWPLEAPDPAEVDEPVLEEEAARAAADVTPTGRPDAGGGGPASSQATDATHNVGPAASSSVAAGRATVLLGRTYPPAQTFAVLGQAGALPGRACPAAH